MRGRHIGPVRLVAICLASLLILLALVLTGCGSTGTDWLGTSPAHSAAREAGLKLGEAVVAYCNGRVDLSEIKALIAPATIAPSGQDGLSQMLSSVGQPSACDVPETSSYVSSSEVDVVLRFTGPHTMQSEFILTVAYGPDKTTIEGIRPSSASGPTDQSP